MLLVPVGGALVNVIVFPDTEYAVLGFCWTLLITASIVNTDNTGRLSVKEVVTPLPLKKSVAG